MLVTELYNGPNSELATSIPKWCILTESISKFIKLPRLRFLFKNLDLVKEYFLCIDRWTVVFSRSRKSICFKLITLV
ncbi:unnamed protein product [Rhizophagus irregularis]|nr:unnamed protein product [Rhizophagus irregularis]